MVNTASAADAQACNAQGRLRDQVAIVTGGSSGIGRAIALSLAREGAKVVVIGRNQMRVNHTVATIDESGTGNSALGLVLDVSREEEMEEMRRQTLERFSRIDILIAAAGIWRGTRSSRLLPHAVATLAVDEWDEVLGTNLRGVFLSNRAVLPTMVAQSRGAIVNIASARGGLYGHPYASAYCASKFGVIGLSESLAAEVKEYGIRVHVVLPDLVDTPMLGPLGISRFGEALPPSRVAALIMQLLTMPDDVILLSPLIAPLMNADRPPGVNRLALHIGRMSR